MIEIYPNLFFGGQHDYEQTVRWEAGWRVVQACREPYHRKALGYQGRAAPRGDPEYLVAHREDLLILNLTDANNPAHIPKPIMDAALAFIEASLAAGRRVLVHCNRGNSRAPAIGLLYLAARTDAFSGLDHTEAHDRFRELYPLYDPARGVRGFLITHWAIYCRAQDGRPRMDSQE
jgi:hypothetical protein